MSVVTQAISRYGVVRSHTKVTAQNHNKINSWYLGMGLRPLSAGFERSTGPVLLSGWCKWFFSSKENTFALLLQMNGEPTNSVIRKVYSKNTERFSNRKFVGSNFSKQTFRDFLQIYNSYVFAINEYVVKIQKIKVVENCLRSIGQPQFLDMLVPPSQKEIRYHKLFYVTWKNQSCSKSPEMARK